MLSRPTLAVPLVALGLLTVGAAHAQQGPIISDSLSLDGTIRSVLDANPAITSLEEEVNAATSRVTQSRGGFLPQISGTATYTRIDPVVKLQLSPDAPVFQLAPNNNYDAHITLQYGLLDFGKKDATYNLAESRRLTATDQINVTRRDLAYSAVQVYYNILFVRESIKVQDAQIASLQQHQREMEKRVEGGVSTRFDVTTTQVRITQAQNTKIDLQNQLNNQQAQLARLLHRPEYVNVPVRGAFAYQPQAIDVNAALATAEANRPEIKLARDAEQTANLNLKLIERSNMPVLGIGGQLGAKNGYLPNLDRIRPNSVGVVQLSVPIYDGNRNKNQRVEAAANIRGAQARILDTQEQVRADVRQAANNIQSSTARYDNALQQINQASDALTRAQARYRYGVGNNLDVLDAETSLAQARLARLQAIYNYTLGQYQLKRATGEQIW
ncbi:TolC family protein [Hymenobacter taeanensis]|uniref:TolC family protein n=1 Tax=Hymenobacter taeanensis TaxID=2735321 RepID=A0A6M6BEK5_9BACT|nr:MULTISPECIES: TolC family protein [Hymenobacter]QJX47001.1 TolC family protein [Hymenobacter taeanensis]UOQ80877.1 TolC family protein [Hymenobacter sp. 5414T-23]